MDNKESKGELVSKGAMALVAGVVLMLAGTWAARELHIVWNIWPSTDGVVVRGAVQEVLDAPYAKGGTPVHRYTPQVEFRYTADGREYTAEAPSVSSADTYDQAQANLVRLYAPGTHHPIRYNPRNPRDIRFGVIELGSLVFSFVLLIGGVVLTTVAFKYLAMGLRQHGEIGEVKEPGTRATVLPFTGREQPEPSAAVLHCPSCGRPITAADYTCPNCLKSLRAA